MRLHFLHGIHTESVSVVQGLIPYLRAAGFQVCYPDYGFILGIETRIVNPIICGSLLPYIEEGDILIGHSNGAAVCYDLMCRGAPAVGGVFINAALERNMIRAPFVKFIDVYYNSGDTITEAAQIAERLGITDPAWGEMGHAGYSGADTSITNVNCGATAGMPVVCGHSAFFEAPNLSKWGPYLAQRLVNYLAAAAPAVAVA